MAAGKHGVDVLDGALVPLATCGNPVMMGANASANGLGYMPKTMQDAQQLVKHINVNVMDMVVEINLGVVFKFTREWNSLY